MGRVRYIPIATRAALAVVKFVGCCTAGIGLIMILEANRVGEVLISSPSDML